MQAYLQFAVSNVQFILFLSVFTLYLNFFYQYSVKQSCLAIEKKEKGSE